MTRNPDTPCLTCGKMLWRTPGKPLGHPQTCRDCQGLLPRVSGGRHGFSSTYNRGCRCQLCRNAHAVRVRRYSLATKAETGHWPNRPARAPVSCTGCGVQLRRALGDDPKCKRCRRGLNLSRDARAAIYERDAWTCGICSERVDRTAISPDPWSATLDHIAPRSRGGSDDPSNLRLAHRYCNTVRSNNEWLTIDDVA